ncbi:FeoC-like transcriptional regulator [Chloroflexota bacterium]
MLARIITEFRNADGIMDLNELGRRLGVERSALEGMLELLVRQGKLREISADGCAHCPTLLSCAHQQPGDRMGKAYELVE